MNLCFDVSSFLDRENYKFNYIKTIHSKGHMKLRKIFTLKNPITHYTMMPMGDDDEERMVEEDSEGPRPIKHKPNLPKDVNMNIECYNLNVDMAFVMSHKVSQTNRCSSFT